MSNFTPDRADFIPSFLKKATRLPRWQRLLAVGFLVVSFTLHFALYHSTPDAPTIAPPFLTVLLTALLFGWSGGVVATLLVFCIELFFLTINNHTNLLATIHRDLLISTFNLMVGGIAVGVLRSITLRSQDQTEKCLASENALREKELRFRTMADLTSSWEAWEDPEGNFIYTSPSVQRFTGYTPETFAKTPGMLWNLTVEEDRPALKAHFDAASGKNPLHQVDIRIRHADGHILWLRHICQPVYDARGAFQGRRASNLDITEIRQANEELKRRLDLEHLISEISSRFIDTPDASIDENLRASLQQVAEFVKAERAFLATFVPNSLVIEEVYRWTNDESPSKTIIPGMDVADFPWMARFVRENTVLHVPSVDELPLEAIAERKQLSLSNPASALAIPLMMENKPIGIFGFSTFTRKQDWQEDDIRSLHLLAEIYTNLLRQRRTHNALVNSEMRFRSTFENAGIGITLVDENSVMMDVNSVMCEMFGYSREEMIGRLTDEITYPEDRRIDYAMVMELIEKNESSLQREIRFLRKDGTLFWGRLTISLVWSQAGKHVYGIGMLEDITEQRRITDELQRRERILEAVSLAAEDLLRLPNWEAGVQRALAALGSASSAHHATIYQFDNETDTDFDLRIIAIWSSDGSEFNMDENWADLVLRRSKDSPSAQGIMNDHLFNGRVDQFPDEMRRKLNELNVVKLLLVPIFVENSMWGIICFDTDQELAWSAAEEEGLKIAANVFGAAFQRQQVERRIEQLYQAEHDQRQMAEALRDTAEALNTSLNLQEVFAQVLLNVEKVVPIDAANIMLIDNGMARVVGARGYVERGAQETIQNVHYRISDFPTLDTMYHQGIPVVTSNVSGSPTWVADPSLFWIHSFAGAPIRQDGQTIGFLNVDSETPDLFTQVHANRLRVFADQASLAIRNAGLFDEAHRRAQQIALLNQMAQSAISAATQPEMFDQMVASLAALFNAESAAILLFGSNEQFPSVAAIVGEATALKGQVSNAELAGFLLVDYPLGIEDLSTRPDVKSAAAILHPCRALLTLPMILNGSRLGVVLIGFTKTRRITSAEVALGEQAAMQVALGISKFRLLEAERTRTRQLARANDLFTALDHVGTRIGAAADSSGVINTLEIELKKLGLSYAVALSDPASGEIVLQNYSFLTHPDWRNRHEKITHLFDRDEIKRPLLNDQTNFYIADPMRMAYGLSSTLDSETVRELIRLAGFTEQTRMFLLPLIVKERPIGLLVIWGALQESDRTVMSAFASQLAVSFYNASLYEEIQRVAITDEMTGLFNRRGMHEFGEREVERAKRFERPLSALMIDLDLFSRVNNTYGHLVGDEVLRLMADRVRANIRELDVAVRFGGEEFLILLVETGAQDAVNIAERIRLAIANSPFETSAGALRITASIGVAEMTPEMSGITHLIARADQALYLAKQNGRNRIMAE